MPAVERVSGLIVVEGRHAECVDAVTVITRLIAKLLLVRIVRRMARGTTVVLHAEPGGGIDRLRRMADLARRGQMRALEPERVPRVVPGKIVGCGKPADLTMATITKRPVGAGLEHTIVIVDMTGQAIIRARSGIGPTSRGSRKHQSDVATDRRRVMTRRALHIGVTSLQ